MRQPHFLLNVPGNHLRNISHIQLAYDEETSACTQVDGIHMRELCAPCNLDHWLKLIQSRLTGLQRIDVFIYLSLPKRRICVDPKWLVNKPWVMRVMALQHCQSGFRELNAFVHHRDGEEEDPWTLSLSSDGSEVFVCWYPRIGMVVDLRDYVERLFRKTFAEDRITRASLNQAPTIGCQYRERDYDPEASVVEGAMTT